MNRRELLILEKFELRKLNKLCNVKNCNKTPSKEAIITEFDATNLKKTDLASLYLCNEHYKARLMELMDNLQEINDGKIINIKVLERGYITY